MISVRASLARMTGLLASATAALLISSAANAVVIVLDFEGVGDLAAINDFYNGGTDSQGNSGTNYGVSFSGPTLGVIDADAGGSGNFANEPSASTIMFFLNANNAILDFAAGFDTGFSFFYTSSTAATVTVYDGIGGAGNILAVLNLVAQGSNDCVGDPNGSFCNWTPIGVLFSGVARSIDFGGTANQTGFDEITFGSNTPGEVPVGEPGTLALLGLGMIGLALRRKRLS